MTTSLGESEAQVPQLEAPEGCSSRGQGRYVATGVGAALLGAMPLNRPDAQTMERMLAGNARGRLGQRERQARLAAPHSQADVAQAELQMGAAEDDDPEEAIANSLTSCSPCR